MVDVIKYKDHYIKPSSSSGEYGISTDGKYYFKIVKSIDEAKKDIDERVKRFSNAFQNGREKAREEIQNAIAKKGLPGSAAMNDIAYRGYLIRKNNMRGTFFIGKGGQMMGTEYKSIDAAKKDIDLLAD